MHLDTSSSTTPAPRAVLLASLVAFCWPFIYLFPYVLPVHQKYLAIGNDFQILYFWYKAYLLDALSNWTLPLWSPSEAAGYPFYSNPFTQTFYPLNIVLAVYYKCAGGYQVIDHQRYAVLAIAIFAVGLLRWLVSLRLGLRAALFATLVLSVSFKLTEILRLPNALHTAAWYPWVLFALTRIAESNSTKRRMANGLVLTGALICLLTGGYPYYVFYSPWLFGPYLVVLLVPRWSRALLGREPANVKGSLFTLAMAGITTLGICGPYLYKTAALMHQTTDRAGENFAYSTEHVFSYEDTIGSWVFPPAAQTEGWYYFGMINVLLILLYLAGPRQPLKLAFLGWIGVISYITYGRGSYLFWLLWHYVPMFSSLRVWGRMNIILVPILAWMLAAAYEYFESLLGGKGPEGAAGQHGVSNLRPALGLAAIGAVLLAVQLYLWKHQRFDEYWTTYYTDGILHQRGSAALLSYLNGLGVQSAITPQALVTGAEGAAVVWGGLGFALLFALLLAPGIRPAGARLKRGVLAGVLALGTLDTWTVGPWAWASAVNPTWERTPLQVALRDAELFATPRADGQGISGTATFNVGVMENWYFKRYVDFLSFGKQEPDALRELLGMVDGRKLRFSESIGHPTVRAFLDDANRFAAVENVRSYTGDRLAVSLRAPTDGYLSVIDNWDPDWVASVDRTPAPIERLFGTFKSVRVRAGTHIVTWAYRPLPLWAWPEI